MPQHRGTTFNSWGYKCCGWDFGTSPVMNLLLGVRGIPTPLLMVTSPKSEGPALSMTWFFGHWSSCYLSCLMLDGCRTEAVEDIGLSSLGLAGDSLLGLETRSSITMWWEGQAQTLWERRPSSIHQWVLAPGTVPSTRWRLSWPPCWGSITEIFTQNCRGRAKTEIPPS